MKAIYCILSALLTVGLSLALRGACGAGVDVNTPVAVAGVALMLLGGLPLSLMIGEGRHER